MTTKSEGRIHLSFLDGARGFAALWVLLNHSYSPDTIAGYIPIPALAALIRFLGAWVNLGHFAVDLFIVLSGFCLMLPVASKGFVQKGGAWLFYKKRAHRILPPYYINILIMGAWLTLAGKFGHYSDNVPPLKAFLVDFLLLEDIVPNMMINPVFWSIAIEWRIYFLLPLFIKIWRSAGPIAMLAASAVIAAAGTVAVVAIYPPVNLPRCCPWYLFLFTLGVTASGLLFGGGENSPLASAAVRKRYLSLVGPLAIVMGCLAVGSYCLLNPNFYGVESGWAGFDPRSPLVDSLAGAFVSATLMLLTLWNAEGRKNLLTQFFDNRILVWAGIRGYSIYLTHPVAGVITGVVFNRIQKSPSLAGDLIHTVVDVALSLVMSALYYNTVERHFLNSPVKGEGGVRRFLGTLSRDKTA